MVQTAERVSHLDLSDHYVFQRSLLAYEEAAKQVWGRVLEIGTGSGYGVEKIASKAEAFTTVDKFDVDLSTVERKDRSNVKFIKMTVPPLTAIENNSFDYVVTFQVIEHIKADNQFLTEAHRVLKPGGKLIVTTPNSKMSITRNPWHIREYSVEELRNLILKFFSTLDTLGVYGNHKVMDYYRKNKASVKKITRFDVFNLQYRLPRTLLQIPYDFLNRFNRKKLLKENRTLTSGISIADYYLEKATDSCLDLYYIATK